MNSLNRLGESYSQAKNNSQRELQNNIPLISQHDFTKSDHDKWQIRKLKREWQIQVAQKCNMLLFPGNWSNIYNVYKKEFMLKTTVLN